METSVSIYTVVFEIYLYTWGAPKAGIPYEPVKNFISFSSLINEFSVKHERKVDYSCAVLSSITLQLYWNHTSVWVFSCKFAAYLQNTYS